MPPPERASYFEAERYAGFLLIAFATASVGFAAFLWIHRSAFIAMAWPLVND